MTLRRGWARAEARPWNGFFPDAHLRLVRGGAAFIEASTSHLLAAGAPTVISPPLARSTQGAWRAAGFEPVARLALLRLALDHALPAPGHLVAAGTQDDLDEAIRIDTAAFEPFWRLDRRGLDEAMQATGRAEMLVIHDNEGGLCGYAVLGMGIALAYLQRVAVDPQWQGNGMGRSIIRVCARRARSGGAQALLLNTQTDNARAMQIYRDEGFEELPEALELMRKSA